MALLHNLKTYQGAEIKDGDQIEVQPGIILNLQESVCIWRAVGSSMSITKTTSEEILETLYLISGIQKPERSFISSLGGDKITFDGSPTTVEGSIDLIQEALKERFALKHIDQMFDTEPSWYDIPLISACTPIRITGECFCVLEPLSLVQIQDIINHVRTKILDARPLERITGFGGFTCYMSEETQKFYVGDQRMDRKTISSCLTGFLAIDHDGIFSDDMIKMVHNSIAIPSHISPALPKNFKAKDLRGLIQHILKESY